MDISNNHIHGSRFILLVIMRSPTIFVKICRLVRLIASRKSCSGYFLEKRFTKANSVPTVEFIPCLAFQSQPKSNTFPIRRNHYFYQVWCYVGAHLHCWLIFDRFQRITPGRAELGGWQIDEDSCFNRRYIRLGGHLITYAADVHIIAVKCTLLSRITTGSKNYMKELSSNIVQSFQDLTMSSCYVQYDNALQQQRTRSEPS